ncbi:MAG: right-handed parallel beta-helix repeat-containing protein [Thermoanaerobaculia bacterium]|nr:right-handed parallel beta-helix repeat-containing protein [Thermoanaerobaculia bacterium]
MIHDLEVRGAAANGINADDGGETGNPLASHHLTFVGLHVHSVGGGGNQDCLKLSGVSDFTVALSEFASCGGNLSGSGVDQVGCHRGLIARNRFHDLSANAIQTKGGSSEIEIRQNRFVDSGARSLNLGGSTGFSFFRPPLSTSAPNAEARDLVVVANLFVGSDAPIAYVGCVGCVVAQNTIVDPGNWILRILQETVTAPPYTFEPCRDGVFANNLVYFNRGAISTHLNIGPNTAPATFTFASNLWYAWDAPAQSQPALPSPETNGLYGVDPELGPGYRIGPASPAAGSGAILPWGWGDLDGACFASPEPRRLRGALSGGPRGRVQPSSGSCAESSLGASAASTASSQPARSSGSR